MAKTQTSDHQDHRRHDGHRPERIGLLGGSFNPIHVGHISMAEVALGELHLQRVILIPSASPPHKQAVSDMAPARHRLAMTRLATAHNPTLRVSEIELERAGPSFTRDLVRTWEDAATTPQELFFIIGADSLHDLPTWRDAASLVTGIDFVVVNRPGHSVSEELSNLRPLFDAAVIDRMQHNAITMEPCGVSSRDIRSRLGRGDSVAGLVTPAVTRYILDHGLYGTAT